MSWYVLTFPVWESSNVIQPSTSVLCPSLVIPLVAEAPRGLSHTVVTLKWDCRARDWGEEGHCRSCTAVLHLSNSEWIKGRGWGMRESRSPLSILNLIHFVRCSTSFRPPPPRKAADKWMHLCSLKVTWHEPMGDWGWRLDMHACSSTYYLLLTLTPRGRRAPIQGCPEAGPGSMHSAMVCRDRVVLEDTLVLISVYCKPTLKICHLIANQGMRCWSCLCEMHAYIAFIWSVDSVVLHYITSL